jgi:hypothetical protein
VVASQPEQAVIDPEVARRVVEAEQGALSWTERLGCRLRFFSYGLVLGSQRFVETQGARVRRLVAGIAPQGEEPGGAAAGGWYVWRRGRAVPVEASG